MTIAARVTAAAKMAFIGAKASSDARCGGLGLSTQLSNWDERTVWVLTAESDPVEPKRFPLHPRVIPGESPGLAAATAAADSRFLGNTDPI